MMNIQSNCTNRIRVTLCQKFAPTKYKIQNWLAQGSQRHWANSFTAHGAFKRLYAITVLNKATFLGGKTLYLYFYERKNN